uniref:Transposase n=1 Tax=Ascaris lumbricoides TaxID=6252 RepID=A0A0M3HZ87_ASCLU
MAGYHWYARPQLAVRRNKRRADAAKAFRVRPQGHTFASKIMTYSCEDGIFTKGIFTKNARMSDHDER